MFGLNFFLLLLIFWISTNLLAIQGTSGATLALFLREELAVLGEVIEHLNVGRWVLSGDHEDVVPAFLDGGDEGREVEVRYDLWATLVGRV